MQIKLTYSPIQQIRALALAFRPWEWDLVALAD